jgi:hypothetical protein
MAGAVFQTVTAGDQTVVADLITITDTGFTVAASIMTDTEAYHFLAMR